MAIDEYVSKSCETLPDYFIGIFRKKPMRGVLHLLNEIYDLLVIK